MKLAPEAMSRPRWLWSFLKTGHMPDLSAPNTAPVGSTKLPTFIEAYYEWMQSVLPSWEDVAWLRAQWDGPFMVKGVIRSDDARRVVAPTGLTASGRTSSNATSGVGTRIESSGSVHLRVGQGQVSSTLSKLSAVATADGGYVLSSHAKSAANGSGNFTSAAIVLQVPQHRFTTLLSQVQRDGNATAIESTSTNVTSQYVDLHARISALEASREQYLTIMSKATTFRGILAVQSQLDTIQSQLEQLQGQMNVLDHETSYAILSVAVATVGSATNEVTHRSGIANAWHDSIGGFVTDVEWHIRIAGPMLFMALLLGTLLVIGRVTLRTVQRRRM